VGIIQIILLKIVANYALEFKNPSKNYFVVTLIASHR